MTNIYFFSSSPLNMDFSGLGVVHLFSSQLISVTLSLSLSVSLLRSIHRRFIRNFRKLLRIESISQFCCLFSFVDLEMPWPCDSQSCVCMTWLVWLFLNSLRFKSTIFLLSDYECDQNISLFFIVLCDRVMDCRRHHQQLFYGRWIASDVFFFFSFCVEKNIHLMYFLLLNRMETNRPFVLDKVSYFGWGNFGIHIPNMIRFNGRGRDNNSIWIRDKSIYLR